jgi:putative membrane protein
VTGVILEAALAYLHLITILTWVVFIGSSTALTRIEWLNDASLARLAWVDRIAAIAAMAVLFTGFARVAWGIKGAAWYGAQPLLWGKLVLWLAMVAIGGRASRRIQGWQRARVAGKDLPTADDVAAVRKRLMIASHLMIVVPLVAVCLARGLGVR